jgi:hypothetical protein
VFDGGGCVATDGVPVAVAVPERRRPEIFCWVLAGRRSHSAWLEVAGSGGLPPQAGTVPGFPKRKPEAIRLQAGPPGRAGTVTPH